MQLNERTIHPEYKALTVVSPATLGGEVKNQDRALWHESSQTAGLCDGVTSSPNSSQAAELVTTVIPALFAGDTSERLAMMCDILMAQRRECIKNRNILFPENATENMQNMLLRVIYQKLSVSFQTTMVAARFMSDEKEVNVHVIIFGDSAFFAFSPNGQLLTSSLDFPNSPHDTQILPNLVSTSSIVKRLFRFSPGDQILVRIEGPLSNFSDLAEQTDILNEHLCNWIVCAPVDSCKDRKSICEHNMTCLRTLYLTSSDRLLIPKYLYGTLLTNGGRSYRVLRYSSTIRPIHSVKNAIATNGFQHRGSATAVLPDHFYNNSFDSFHDRFPLRSHFLLCSDGFYSSFDSWQELWNWLQKNKFELHHNDVTEVILRQLHDDLHAKSGDDDISFIWVQPNELSSSKTDPIRL